MKKRTWKIYAAWILLCEAVGALSAWLTRSGNRLYAAAVVQPPLSPPRAVFPIVWSALYALMGVGAACVYLTPASERRTRSLLLFFVQLALNFVWSFLFFQLQAFGFSFFWLLALWGFILRMTFSFHRVHPTAALLQIPYLLWVAFAGYLNGAVWLLNR